MDLIQKAKNLGCIIKNDEYYLWEIQKWLREIHYSDIIISSNLIGYGYILYNRVLFKNFNNQSVYQTYEEALEAGLQEALKLIKP